MNAATRLAALHRAMDAIGAALEGGEVDAMPPMLEAYERDLQAFCALDGADTLRDGIQALHDRHHQTIARMRDHQAHLTGLIRQQRQSSRAVHAYAGAGAD